MLPEDEATRNIAVGFSDYATGQMQVLNPSGGWTHVKGEMVKTYVAKLRKYADCHLVLFIDFDDDFPNRLAVFQQEIPADVASRVYVVGALTEAETLKNATKKKLGPIGLELARECEQGKYEMWNHPQVLHNQSEVQRLHVAVKGFLF